MAETRCVAQLINIKRWQGHGIEDTGTRGAAFLVGVALSSAVWAEIPEAGAKLCVGSAELGDSAFGPIPLLLSTMTTKQP